MIADMKRASFLLAAGLCAAIAAGPAAAKKGGRDQDDAAQAVRDGRAMPVAEILKRVRGMGEVLEIELDDDDGRLVYEIKFLDKRGRRVEVYVDARTGAVLKREDDD